ncbi:GNS1/SUR4 family domain-containing protein [Ditylenchus destructor]|uniref:Elongation of very long chain fatty acids protein n=1 Tax=Ditylenchus destructor TaxID=166010 RepID=A0AAD4MVF5_9BILA|nr:GNS1/SUR4 family domain-containing protein [Ditylenchus destructor]
MEGFLRIVTQTPFNYAAARKYVSSVQLSSFLVSIGYVVVIFSIKAIMTNRKPFQILMPLRLWNLSLALFSIAGTAISSVAMVQEINKYGIVSTYTKSQDLFEGTSGLFAFLFCMSKLAELGDTLFIVLRKKPLVFLHWFHHVATLNYALMSYVDKSAYNTWIVQLNFMVHAAMYSYYFLSSCGIRLPAWFSRMLTTFQIAQFLITLVILAHVGWKMAMGEKFDVTRVSYFSCLLMEISYVILFGNFFYQAYVAMTSNGFLAMVSNGFFSGRSPSLDSTFFILYCFILHTNVMWIPVQFVYRYRLLCKYNANATRTNILIGAVVTIYSTIAFLTIKNTCEVHDEYQTMGRRVFDMNNWPKVKDNRQQFTMGSYVTHFRTVSWTILWAFTSFASIIIVIWCEKMISRHFNHMGNPTHRATQRMHKEFHRALLAMAICPLITTTVPTLYFCATIILQLRPGWISVFMASATSSITLFNPLTTIICFRCYRQVILRLIACCRYNKILGIIIQESTVPTIT